MAWLNALWRHHRRWLIAGGVVLIAAVALVGYLLLKRPADVSRGNEEPFSASEPKETFKLVNWPLYGYDLRRTRYLPTGGAKPPFQVKWRYDSGALMEYSPIVVDNVIYGINNRGEVFALRVSNGKPIWKRRVASVNASAPTYSHGRIYVSNLTPGQVVALKARNGHVVWRHPLPGRTESSPIVLGRKVVVGCECGDLYALDKRTGNEIWAAGIGGAVKSAPAYDHGVVFVGDYSGHVTAVDLSNGGVKWQSGGQSQGLGQFGTFYAAPTVAFGRVYVGNTDGRMYSFVESNGTLAWSKTTSNYVYAAAVAANTPDTAPTIYFGSYDGTFYALNARDGVERWSRRVGGAVSGAASLIGDVVYVANLHSTRTVGLNIRNGKRLFIFPDGAYNPVISDGHHLFLTGYSTIYALKSAVKKGGKRKAQIYGRHLPRSGAAK